MPDPDVSPEELATALAAHLIHDAIGPASGIVSAFELAADPAASGMRDEALALAEEGARNLLETLTTLRAIFTSGEALAPEALGEAAESLFAGARATLDLTVDPAAVSNGATRIVLGTLRIAAATAASGGVVSATLTRRAQRAAFDVRVTGPRLRVHPEVVDGLSLRRATTGAAHRWSEAYFLAALACALDGAIVVSASAETVTFQADIRLDIA